MVTIGDIKLDTFVVLNDASIQCQLKMPECQLCLAYGKKISVGVVDSQIAGSAANVAVGLSRLGRKTAVVSVMGKDSTRQLAFETLKRERVDTRLIKIHAKAKSSFAVVLNYKGEKTILTSFTPCTFRLPRLDPCPRWLYVSELGKGYELLFEEILRARERHPLLRLAFNPGVVQIKERKRVFWNLLKITDVLFTNKEEAQEIAAVSTREVHQLLSFLRRLGPSYVVMTNGREGAYAANKGETLFCPIFPGERVEATGAGDAFASGFLGAWMKKTSLEEALRWGSVNASSVVGFVGPQAGLLSEKKIHSRLRTHPDFCVISL